MDAINQGNIIPSQKYYKLLVILKTQRFSMKNFGRWVLVPLKPFKKTFKTFKELKTSESVSLQFTEEVLKENGKR